MVLNYSFKVHVFDKTQHALLQTAATINDYLRDRLQKANNEEK